MNTKNKVKSKPTPNKKIKENREGNKFLILHNDDINSFEFVIDTLIEVCKHDKIQAEQCAFITHYKGKCDIKVGDYDYLNTFKEQLSSKGLLVTIE